MWGVFFAPVLRLLIVVLRHIEVLNLLPTAVHFAADVSAFATASNRRNATRTAKVNSPAVHLLRVFVKLNGRRPITHQGRFTGTIRAC